MSTNFRMHPEHNNLDEWLGMSNGGTAVFLSVLALSGSRLAQEQKEKELIVWIIEHDDIVMGRGCNEFDINEMPWDLKNFEKERSFIISVINGAKEKLGWETLNYEPNESFVFSYLDTFYKLITNFDPKYIDKEAYLMWVDCKESPRFCLPEGFPNCDEKSKRLGNKTLEDYDKLILKFEQYLEKDAYREWIKKQKFPYVFMPSGFQKCNIHNTFLYWHGCIVCNDC